MSARARRDRSPRAELQATVVEHRHVLEEHRCAHADSRVRRHLERRVHELETRFEELLQEWALDEELQAAWRAHLRAGAPTPAEPVEAWPLVFRGIAETGSDVEIRERADGAYDVTVDGSLVERIEAALDFAGTTARREFDLDGTVFHETFVASGPALEALDDFVAEGLSEPPWPAAPELIADGLVDSHFGLTPRGHRALAQSSVQRTG
jgi:hypothetical protein